jgi:chemotaxis-related protein WspD
MKKDQNRKHRSKTSKALLSSLPQEAARLFERPPDEAYMQEWTQALKEPISTDDISDALSVLIFRLGKEWLALPTVYFKEVAPCHPVHHIPHRSGQVLQGLVNLNGKLELYIHLHALLQIEMLGVSPLYPPQSNGTLYEGNAGASSRNRAAEVPQPQFNRMMAIIKDGELWVFPVDEIEGIHNWNLSAIENTPSTISKSTVNYIKGIMRMDDKIVGLLDEELLFSSLRRSAHS